MEDCVDVFVGGPKKSEVVGRLGWVGFFLNELMLKSSYQVFYF